MKSIFKKFSAIIIATLVLFGMSSCMFGANGGGGYEQTVDTPIFSVTEGGVTSGTELTISCATSGAKIYYTTDESAPTAKSTAYTGAISITEDVTVKAIAVKEGMNDSAVASASYTIKADYSGCAVGDFILKDGTILPKNETPESGTVAAVIVRAATETKPALGLGIVHKQNLEWCKYTADGYNINITELQGDKENGFQNGSDGWTKLKAACSDAKDHPENYPVWNYSLTYATTNGLTGDLATGWYLPTIAELVTIHQNKPDINPSLTKAGGTLLTKGNYWSSCQALYLDNCAQALSFDDSASANGYYKNETTSIWVCAVKTFN